MGALLGKIALVTGAGTGIGKCTAMHLATEGAHVILVGRRAGILEAVVSEITSSGGAATAVAADITDSKDVGRLVESVRAEFGEIDIVVHNAGAASRTLNVRWIGEAEWNEVLAVNLTAVYLLTQAILPAMISRGDGTIITVSSLAAVRPNDLGGAAYGAAKAGVRNFMTYLHNTFRNDGIRATCILPGEVSTPIMDDRASPPPADVRAAMVQPDDVARAITLCAALPSRTVIEELVIAPRRLRDVSADLAVSRNQGAPTSSPPVGNRL